MRIDIVIPVYNEERRIDRTLDVYRRACPDPEFRFLVALDGSSDGTADVVLRHGQSDPRVVLLDYPKLGKGGVIMETFGLLRPNSSPSWMRTPLRLRPSCCD